MDYEEKDAILELQFLWGISCEISGCKTDPPPLSDGVFDTFLDIWRHDVVERVVTCVWCSSATLDSVSGNADHGAATYSGSSSQIIAWGGD